METVRRDTCAMTRELFSHVLNLILIEDDVPGAIEYTKNTISNLLQGKTDLSRLVITKGLTKDEETYMQKQAHGAVALKMHKRDPNTAPVTGDRVAYVVTQGPAKAKLFEKTEDPLWVLEHNIPIDTHYYLSNQLQKPLTRIFRSFVDNPAILWTGDHTLSISKPTPTTGGIMSFTKKTKQCIGCRVTLPLSELNQTTCLACRPRERDFCIEQIQKTRVLEQRFARLWTQCQVCQGSLLQPVICTNRDCPIFYMRKRVQKDLEEATAKINGFDALEW